VPPPHHHLCHGRRRGGGRTITSHPRACDPSISPCGIRVGNYAHEVVALYVLGGEGSRFNPSAPAWPSASCYGRVSKKIQTWQLPVSCLSVGVVLFMNAITPSIALTYIKTLYFELPFNFDRRAFLSTTDREEIEGAKSQKKWWPLAAVALRQRSLLSQSLKLRLQSPRSRLGGHLSRLPRPSPRQRAPQRTPTPSGRGGTWPSPSSSPRRPPSAGLLVFMSFGPALL
jgi:hypothetical protein